jgi:uncharacterized membrane protein (UPF0182 family)
MFVFKFLFELLYTEVTWFTGLTIANVVTIISSVSGKIAAYICLILYEIPLEACCYRPLRLPDRRFDGVMFVSMTLFNRQNNNLNNIIPDFKALYIASSLPV